MLLVVLGNSQLYGGVVKITARASIDDGLLDVCIIKGNSLWSAPFRILSIVTQRYNLDPKIDYHRAREVKIAARRQLPLRQERAGRILPALERALERVVRPVGEQPPLGGGDHGDRL